MLLKSCATPPASVPSASSLRARCNCSSSWRRCARDSTSSVTSAAVPLNSCGVPAPSRQTCPRAWMWCQRPSAWRTRKRLSNAGVRPSWCATKAARNGATSSGCRCALPSRGAWSSAGASGASASNSFMRCDRWRSRVRGFHSQCPSRAAWNARSARACSAANAASEAWRKACSRALRTLSNSITDSAEAANTATTQARSVHSASAVTASRLITTIKG